MNVLPLVWCPWSAWSEVNKLEDRCSRSRVESRRVRCCYDSDEALWHDGRSALPKRMKGCIGPSEERSQTRNKLGVQCQALDGSATYDSDFHSEFVLIFGGVIIFVGITWAFCRCCRWWIMNCDDEDPAVIPSRDDNTSPQPGVRIGYRSFDADFEDCELASVYSPSRRLRQSVSISESRREHRPSLFSTMSAIEAVSVAQRLMEGNSPPTTNGSAVGAISGGGDSPTLMPLPPVEDGNEPPAYSDVTATQLGMLIDSPPAGLGEPPAYTYSPVDCEEAPPPAYEEATMLTPPPPRYEDL